MAARCVLCAFFLGGAIGVQADADAAWDDVVHLIQQSKFDTKPNKTLEFHRLQHKREKRLASAGTGIYCLSDATDVVGRVGCMGGGMRCASCLNGIITCNEGYSPLIDFYGKMNCATPGRRDLCMERGCTLGGCCEQTCCPPKLTAAAKKEMRQVFNVSKYVGHVPHPRMPHPTGKQMGEALSYVKKPMDIIAHPRMPHPTREQMGEALSYFKKPSHTHTETAKKPSAVKSGAAPLSRKASSVSHPRTAIAKKTSTLKSGAASKHSKTSSGVKTSSATKMVKGFAQRQSKKKGSNSFAGFSGMA